MTYSLINRNLSLPTKAQEKLLLRISLFFFRILINKNKNLSVNTISQHLIRTKEFLRNIFFCSNNVIFLARDKMKVFFFLKSEAIGQTLAKFSNADLTLHFLNFTFFTRSIRFPSYQDKKINNNVFFFIVF
jgi:hypothetical protein